MAAGPLTLISFQIRLLRAQIVLREATLHALDSTNRLGRDYTSIPPDCATLFGGAAQMQDDGQDVGPRHTIRLRRLGGDTQIIDKKAGCGGTALGMAA